MRIAITLSKELGLVCCDAYGEEVGVKENFKNIVGNAESFIESENIENPKVIVVDIKEADLFELNLQTKILTKTGVIAK